MSDFSTKNILPELINNNEFNYTLPKYINIVNKKNNEFVSNFLPQTGGSWNKRNKNNTDDEINQLISMLTSDSEDKNNFTVNSTQTDILENRLKNMAQNGGDTNKKKISQKGGSNAKKEDNSNSPTSSFSNLFTSNQELIKKNSNNISFLRANGNNELTQNSVTSSVIPNNNGVLSITSKNEDVTSSLVPFRNDALSSTSINKSENFTSSVIPSRNEALSPTSTDVKNNDTLFDVAATFISNTAKKVTDLFNNDSSHSKSNVSTEGVTSSPSGTVMSNKIGTVMSDKTSSVELHNINSKELSPTSSEVKNVQIGGGKKRRNKK